MGAQTPQDDPSSEARTTEQAVPADSVELASWGANLLSSGLSLEELEKLVGAAFFMVDANQDVVAFGPEMERITGFDASEVVGRHCLSAFRCAECLRDCGVFRRGTVGPVDVTLYRKDGGAARVRKSGIAIRDDSGEAKLSLEMVRPTEADTDESGDQAPPDAMNGLDRLLGALGRHFIALDTAGLVVRHSNGLAALMGRPEADLRGIPAAELLGEELFGPDSDFLQAILAGQRREGWRSALLAAGGEPIPVSLSAAPVGDAPGAPPNTGCAPRSAVLIVLRPDSQGADGAPEDGETVLFSGMIARSPAMLQLFRLIDQLRESDATVLVTGESGTGKELIARAIHDRSLRAQGPFAVINCGALPPDLLESELFGHARGAFTGAIRDKVGRVELADGGTLFLDEIGDLPLHLQVKILRLLQERTFERVGETKTRTVDARVVAATHVDLARAVAERQFRDDLYYRLRVVPIHVPPLRERRVDIEPLVTHLLERIGRRRGRALRLAPTTLRALLSHDWPGNVRELENTLEYATAVCEGQTIHADDLPGEVLAGPTQLLSPPPPPSVAPRPEAAPSMDGAAAERERLRAALEQTRYQRQKAAELLGISRWTLWRKMKEHRLD